MLPYILACLVTHFQECCTLREGIIPVKYLNREKTALYRMTMGDNKIVVVHKNP